MNILTEDGLKTLMSEIKAFVKGKVPTKTSQLTNDSDYIASSMALVDELGANRFAFINPDAVAIEHSTDGGLTWINSKESNQIKQMIFTNSDDTCIWLDEENAYVSTSIDSQVRVTLTLYNRPNLYLHTKLSNILISLDNGKHSCEIKLETRTGENYLNNKDEWATVGIYKKPPASDNSWVDIPVDLEVGDHNSIGYVWQIRFTFYYTEVSTDQYVNARVNAIFGYGPDCEHPTSNMGKTGHLYDYDMNQNVTFPAEVTATNFKGKINGYTIDKSVPSNAQFTDTTYDLSPYAKTSEVDSKLSTKADKNTSVIITLPKTGWTEPTEYFNDPTYEISVPVNGVTANDDILIDIYIQTSHPATMLPDTIGPCGHAKMYEPELAKIKYAEAIDGKIKFYSTEASLSMDVPLIVRKL